MTLRLFRPQLLAGILLGPILACSGCQQAAYRGAEPSARSFYEDPDFHQTYIGVDFCWALQDPAPHVPERHEPISAVSLQP